MRIAGHRHKPFACWWHRKRQRTAATYSGAHVSRNGKVPRISAEKCSSRRFFKKFVAQRRPVVLTGLLPELARLEPEWWAPEAARDLIVQAEVRDGPKDRFGRGQRKPIKFGKLLQLLKAGSTSHYMTTQEIPDGHLVAPPLTALAPGILPLRPKLLRTLCPQSINMWLGRSDSLVSSGLHHDFHDNLYTLLHG